VGCIRNSKDKKELKREIIILVMPSETFSSLAYSTI
jgi:hypothetical protein